MLIKTPHSGLFSSVFDPHPYLYECAMDAIELHPEKEWEVVSFPTTNQSDLWS